MTFVLEILAAILMVLGSGMVAIGAIGVARLPDVYCRAHALTVSMTLGISLLLIGLWCAENGNEVVGLKVLVAIVFVFATVPVAGHLIAAVALEMKLPQHHDKLGTEQKSQE